MMPSKLIKRFLKVLRKPGVFFYKAQETIARKKLKGGALFISVMLSVIIGCILTLFILVTTYNQRNVTVFAQSSQLFYNLKSAFQLAQSAYFTPEKNYTWMKNQLNDDSIRIKKLHWGAYLIICAETKNRHQYLSESGLFGTCMSPDTGLMVADNSRPVGLSGNVIFKSACYLPRAGVKPAYIEGQSYISNASNGRFTRQSPSAIPAINLEMVKGLKQQLSLGIQNFDSLVTTLPIVFNQSFNQSTVLWETSTTQLTNLQLSNNIKIIAGSLQVDSSVHLNNILIVCKNIRFKKGFKGKVHVIASDSISMEEGCEFSYPSSFVVFSEKAQVTGFSYIQFNKDCKFFGGVLALNDPSDANSLTKVFIKLNADSEINGFIYSSDYIHIEGQVNATVMANKLLLKTPSAVYENHLLGCEINPKKYSDQLAIPLVFNQRAKLVCCEKIN